MHLFSFLFRNFADNMQIFLAYARILEEPTDTFHQMNNLKKKATLSILLMVSMGHLLNDMFQSVIPSIYPIIKESLGLSFMQIGAITLTNQITASLLQPMVGYFSDRHPRPYGLVVGMCPNMRLVISGQLKRELRAT